MDPIGWIKLHRKLLLSDIFQNEKMLKIFIYCMLKASHTDHEQRVGRQIVKLEPGQFVFGRKKAAAELNMTESTVRDYMNLLKNDKVIVIKSTNKFSVVTIENWEFYQQEEKTTDNKQSTIQANKQTSNRQEIDTNKNEKNEKNEKNDKNIQQQQGDPEENWVHSYEKYYGIVPPMVIQMMNSYLDDGMDQKTISFALEKAADNGQPFHYAKAIINKWISKGILTYQEALSEEEAFKKRKVERIHGNKRPQANRPSPNIKGADLSQYDFSSNRNSL